MCVGDLLELPLSKNTLRVQEPDVVGGIRIIKAYTYMYLKGLLECWGFCKKKTASSPHRCLPHPQNSLKQF